MNQFIAKQFTCHNKTKRGFSECFSLFCVCESRLVLSCLVAFPFFLLLLLFLICLFRFAYSQRCVFASVCEMQVEYGRWWLIFMVNERERRWRERTKDNNGYETNTIIRFTVLAKQFDGIVLVYVFDNEVLWTHKYSHTQIQWTDTTIFMQFHAYQCRDCLFLCSATFVRIT